MPNTVSPNSWPHLFEAFRLIGEDTSPRGWGFTEVSVPDRWSAGDIDSANRALGKLRGKHATDIFVALTEDATGEDMLYEFCNGEETNRDLVMHSDLDLIHTSKLLDDFFDGFVDHTA